MKNGGVACIDLVTDLVRRMPSFKLERFPQMGKSVLFLIVLKGKVRPLQTFEVT